MGVEENIRVTTEEFLNAYITATEKNDAAVFSETLAPDCRRFIGPPSFLISLGIPPGLSFSNEAYEKLSVKDLEVWAVTSCEIANVTVDVGNLKSAATSNYTGAFSDGSQFKRHLGWFLDFNEDGTKIKKIYQLNDTQEAKDFRLKVEELQKADEK